MTSNASEFFLSSAFENEMYSSFQSFNSSSQTTFDEWQAFDCEEPKVKAPKRVRFSTGVTEVVSIPGREEYSHLEKDAMWYNKHEYQTIRATIYEQAKEARYNNSSDEMFIRRSKFASRKRSVGSNRGIEHLQSVALAEQRENTIKSVVSAVLYAQEEKKANIKDLRKASRKLSEWSRRKAEEMGRKDAAAANKLASTTTSPCTPSTQSEAKEYGEETRWKKILMKKLEASLATDTPSKHEWRNIDVGFEDFLQ